jgi:phosphoenolpyruvate carboxylase
MITREGIDRVRELYCESPFLRALVNNAQLALTRADIDVARSYSTLAGDDSRGIFELIEAEHGRAIGRVLEVVDRHRLLGNAPHLVETVKRRNPYVDVLSHAQIELLRRLRAADVGDDAERVLAALFITINGIAAGLQTAG